MRKIKPRKKQENVAEKSMSSKKITLIAGIAGVVLLLFVVLMFVESLNKSQISIDNTTSRNITSMKVHFLSYEGDKQTDNIVDMELAAGETYKASLPDLSELKDTASGLILKVTFEDEEEVTIDSGFFNTKFDGKIKVVFEEDDLGEVTMKVKASTGLFGSTSQTLCNDTYEMHLLDEE